MLAAAPRTTADRVSRRQITGAARPQLLFGDLENDVPGRCDGQWCDGDNAWSVIAERQPVRGPCLAAHVSKQMRRETGSACVLLKHWCETKHSNACATQLSPVISHPAHVSSSENC